ncbi:hypothetical protein CHUAL_010978 [Chamberlinius hualienensis]
MEIDENVDIEEHVEYDDSEISNSPLNLTTVARPRPLLYERHQLIQQSATMGKMNKIFQECFQSEADTLRPLINIRYMSDKRNPYSPFYIKLNRIYNYIYKVNCGFNIAPEMEMDEVWRLINVSKNQGHHLALSIMILHSALNYELVPNKARVEVLQRVNGRNHIGYLLHELIDLKHELSKMNWCSIETYIAYACLAVEFPFANDRNCIAVGLINWYRGGNKQALRWESIEKAIGYYKFNKDTFIERWSSIEKMLNTVKIFTRVYGDHIANIIRRKLDGDRNDDTVVLRVLQAF